MYYDLKGFGSELRRIRKSLHLSQKQVRDAIGLNEDTLRKLENGSSMPRIETLDLLSITFKTDIFRIFSNYKINVDTYFEKRIIEILPSIRSLDYKTIEQEVTQFHNTFVDSKSYKIKDIRKKMEQFGEYLKSLSNFEHSFKDQSRDDLTKLVEVTGVSLSEIKDGSSLINLDKLEIRIFILISIIYRFKDEFRNSVLFLEAALKSVLKKYDDDKDFLYFYFLVALNLMTVYHRQNEYEKIDALYKSSLKVLDGKLSVNTLATYFIRVGINKNYVKEEEATYFVNFGLDLLKDTGYVDKSERYRQTFSKKYPFLNL